jgi:hypothetical protein
MFGYLCKGWRDSLKEPGVITDVITCGAIFFLLKG